MKRRCATEVGSPRNDENIQRRTWRWEPRRTEIGPDKPWHQQEGTHSSDDVVSEKTKWRGGKGRETGVKKKRGGGGKGGGENKKKQKNG